MPTDLPDAERPIRPAGSMQLDPTGDGIATDETRRLISSSKVEGTAVFDRTGREIGTISCFMVDKISGQVGYVVMSFGGFLGLGESVRPLPWRALAYDVALGGYVIDDLGRALGADSGEVPPEDAATPQGLALDAYRRTSPTA